MNEKTRLAVTTAADQALTTCRLLILTTAVRLELTAPLYGLNKKILRGQTAIANRSRGH